MRLDCRCTCGLVNGGVNGRAMGHVIATLRVRVLRRASSNLGLRVPTCHISMRHPYSIMRSVLHMCKCGGIRVPSSIGSALGIGNSTSGDRGLRGLITRRLIKYKFGRVLGGSLRHTTCCSNLRDCPTDHLIGLVGPLDSSLGTVHRALLFNNLRYVTRGTGHGGTSLGFFRFKGYCCCARSGHYPSVMSNIDDDHSPRIVGRILSTCSRSCRLKL